MNESNYKVLSPRAQSPSIEINAAQLSPTHNATENVNPKSHSILTVDANSDDYGNDNIISRTPSPMASSFMDGLSNND